MAAGLYRRLLKDEVTSGRIDKAASPAQVGRARLGQLGSLGGTWCGRVCMQYM